MTHMQAARDIRRGNHDAVSIPFTACIEIALVFPGLVPALFYRFRVVSLFHEIGVLKTKAGDYTPSTGL
jgi:hypothetical protein